MNPSSQLTKPLNSEYNHTHKEYQTSTDEEKSSNSITLNNNTLIEQNKQTKKEKTDLEILRSVSVFELFPNRALGKLSINYTLYLQFFYSSIWIFIGIYLFYFAFSFYFPVCSEVYQADCRTIPDQNQSLILILFGGVALRLLRLYQDKKILASQSLQDIQCTEDLFSIFLENVPLNRAQHELEDELNNVLNSSGVQGRVVDAIRIQDFYEYSQKKKRLEKIEEILASEKITISKRVALIKEKGILEAQFSALEDSLLRFEHYKGKVILILSSFEAKEVIQQYFYVPWWEFKRFFGERIKTSKLTEPHDVIFANLCYPKFHAFLRTIACNLVGLPLVLAMTYAIFQVRLTETLHISGICNEKESSPVASLLSSLLTYILTQVLYTIMEKIYKQTYHYKIYISATEAKISHQSFVIYTKTLLLVVLQLFLVYYLPNCIAWPLQMTATTILVILESLTTKFLKLVFNRGSTEFDIIGEVSSIIPIVLFGFTFPFTDPQKMLPCIIISLYLMVLIDKKRLVQFSEPLSLKSPNYLLRLFGFLKLDHICILIGGCLTAVYIFVQDDAKLEEKIPTDIEHDLDIFYGYVAIEFFLLLGFIVLPLLFWRGTLRSQIEERYIRKNYHKTYESESHAFNSFYKTCDPYYQLKERREQKGLTSL